MPKMSLLLTVLVTLSVTIACGRKAEEIPRGESPRNEEFRPDPLKIHGYEIRKKFQGLVGEERVTHILETDRGTEANYRIFSCAPHESDCDWELIQVRCLGRSECLVFIKLLNGTFQQAALPNVLRTDDVATNRRKIEFIYPAEIVGGGPRKFLVLAVGANGQESPKTTGTER